MNKTKDLILISKKQADTFLKNELHMAYEIIKKTYLDFFNAKSINPPSTFLWYDNETRSRIIGLAAYLGDKNTCPGIKWIASCPENISKGLPRASALIILNDYETGFPLAIIDGATISALRTSLSALLALAHLHSGKEIPYLGIIGCGFIAKTFVLCAKALGWKINNILLNDTNQEKAMVFAQNISSDITVQLEKNLNDLLQKSDALLFATTEVNPYIHDPNLFKEGATILNISLRDIGQEIVLSSYNIVDDIEHVLSANTAPHRAYIESRNKDFIAGSIAELILGTTKPSGNKLKIFSPMGMGVLDIALANLVLSHYLTHKSPNIIHNFFEV